MKPTLRFKPHLRHSHPRRYKRQKKFMTVCVAALAAHFRAIVCLADKALSYGDSIQWDSDSSKILKLNPSGGLVMFSGSEEPSSKVLAGLIEKADDVGNKKRPHTITVCEDQYKEAMDELVEAKFLTPRLLKRTDYLSAITGATLNDYMRGVADDIDKFEMACDLLVCGFDINRVPFILSVGHPGIATDMTVTGFHAIGSGWDKAVSRLLFSDHKREHDIARVLYDAFDAKASAEMAAGVGYEWDAVIVIGGSIGFVDVTKEIKQLIERVWAKSNRSPFEAHNRKEDLPLPPKDWKAQLESLIDEQIGSKLRQAQEERDREQLERNANKSGP